MLRVSTVAIATPTPKTSEGILTGAALFVQFLGGSGLSEIDKMNNVDPLIDKRKRVTQWLVVNEIIGCQSTNS